MEMVGYILGIAASILSIYSILRSKEADRKVEYTLNILKDSGVEINYTKGKKNRQANANRSSAAIIGKNNSVQIGNKGDQDHGK
ncbi:hypothetical protein [Listeria newyorkensis]|uniref:Uncharacterized protein n=1 Tax=Listeria newyorkensis TaxID=1497681 RepID=A0A841Z0X4_9LIST|nr:hypothetical protein [Listeria newyorkensis]MBC1458503.1 hypothetical protein [Listeria newyorkensis]